MKYIYYLFGFDSVQGLLNWVWVKFGCKLNKYIFGFVFGFGYSILGQVRVLHAPDQADLLALLVPPLRGKTRLRSIRCLKARRSPRKRCNAKNAKRFGHCKSDCPNMEKDQLSREKKVL